MFAFYLRSPSGQQSWNLSGFNNRSRLFHLQRLSADGGCSQQDGCDINPGCSAALVEVNHLHACTSSSSRNVPVPFCSTRVEGGCDCFGGWWHCLWLRNLGSALWSQESVCLLQEGVHQHQGCSWGGRGASLDGRIDLVGSWIDAWMDGRN